MKYAVISYDEDNNIGDDIQGLATGRQLPSVDARISRERLHEYKGTEPHLLPMNGWFCHHPELWPPASALKPVFFGFHATPRVWNEFRNPRLAEYFKANAPIGCRDRATETFFQSMGIPAFYSKCLTLTFPRRQDSGASRDGSVFVVDAEHIPIPKALADGAVQVSHRVPPYLDAETKQSIARQLIDLYRDHARLVITTRLHSALPCMAMGIPVVFFGDSRDPRFSPLVDLGVPVNELPPNWGYWVRRRKSKPGTFSGPIPDFAKKMRFGPPKHWLRLAIKQVIRKFEVASFNRKASVDWNPAPLDLEGEKQRILERFRQAMSDAERRPK